MLNHLVSQAAEVPESPDAQGAAADLVSTAISPAPGTPHLSIITRRVTGETEAAVSNNLMVPLWGNPLSHTAAIGLNSTQQRRSSMARMRGASFSLRLKIFINPFPVSAVQVS
jgi:hypothetical protein